MPGTRPFSGRDALRPQNRLDAAPRRFAADAPGTRAFSGRDAPHIDASRPENRRGAAVRRLAGVAVAAACAPVLGPAAAPVVAAQPTPAHRAAVIVDTGTEVRRVCVRFAEESITGIEALTRAGTDPVLRAFSGKGAAVCSLCGTGCPGDETCLTCDPGGRFWSYSRAPAGTAALRTSGVGASSTTVRDGDVEGWRWGTGGTPPFATVAEVCGEAPDPSTTTTAATAPPPGPATAPPPAVTTAPSPATTLAPRPRAGAPTTAATTTVAAPPETTAPPPAADTTTAAPPTTTTAEGNLTASRRPPADGASPWGLAAFGAALAGLAGWAAVARRRRRREGP